MISRTWNNINLWFYEQTVLKNFNSFLGYIFFIFVTLVVAFISVALGHKIGLILFCLILAIPVFLICFIKPIYGLFIAIGYSASIFLLQRLLGDYPFSLGIDVIILISFTGLLIQKKSLKNIYIQSPVNAVIVAWVIFNLIEIFNPNAGFADLSINIRGNIIFLITYVLILNLTTEVKFIKIFFKFWFCLAFLAGLYALYQEFIGLPSFDLKWVTSTQELIGLNFIGGRWRKWSFLSDCTAFGMFMAFSSLMCYILMLGPSAVKEKVMFFIAGCVMLLAMVYSGTRTAYVLVPAGLSIYILLTIDQKRTMAFFIFSLFIFAAILFGPFYGPNINRFRTAFTPTSDASFDVREYNRKSVQPYIYEHPLGGGLNTTGDFGRLYHPNHELAGFPPDSGYLKTALETGWIGLILRFLMFFVIMATGVYNFFKVKTERFKYYYLAILAGFFSLTVAFFAQVSIFQYPMSLILYCIYALMNNLRFVEESYLNSQDSRI